MKIVSLVLFLFCIYAILILPQRKFDRDGEMREKIAQLEKIKLIEVMNMDEETTLRFFSRRSEFQRQHEEMRGNLDKKISDLESTLKSAKMITDAELQSMIDEILNLHLALEKERGNFIRSLDDILTTDQIARYVVFERRFKDELRRLLFHERKPRNLK
jgi:hypothetical protein